VKQFVHNQNQFILVPFGYYAVSVHISVFHGKGQWIESLHYSWPSITSIVAIISNLWEYKFQFFPIWVMSIVNFELLCRFERRLLKFLDLQLGFKYFNFLVWCYWSNSTTKRMPIGFLLFYLFALWSLPKHLLAQIYYFSHIQLILELIILNFVNLLLVLGYLVMFKCLSEAHDLGKFLYG